MSEVDYLISRSCFERLTVKRLDNYQLHRYVIVVCKQRSDGARVVSGGGRRYGADGSRGASGAARQRWI